MSNPILDDQLQTKARLVHALRGLGVSSGDIVCVHVSMSSLGLVIGGARTVVSALIEAVGPSGTVMMPAFSGDLSDPIEWRHPPLDTELIDEARDAIPAYDPMRTPTRGMGVVAEYFRSSVGVLRSPHPQSSFCAIGADAELLVGQHEFDMRFGPNSPLGKLYDVGGKVLLLGAPFNTASIFHLIEHMRPGVAQLKKGAPVVERGVYRWVSYTDVEYPTYWFGSAIRHLIDKGIAKSKIIGGGESIIFPADVAVDEVLMWGSNNEVF